MKIFISHSSKDKMLVDHFVDLLQVMLVPIENIFCSSVEGTKIESGENWRNTIKGQLADSKIAFLLLSENYKNSEICQNELGAIWMTENLRVIPLAFDSLNANSIGILQEVNQIERITDENSLERIKDIVLKLSPNQIKSDRWNDKKKDFISRFKNDYQRMVIDNALEYQKLFRGGFTSFVADSTLSHAQSLNNIDLNKQLINDLQNNKNLSIDLKFNYLGSLCAGNWLKLSGDPSYAHSKLIAFVKDNLHEIWRAMNLSLASKIDFVSLGPGDGTMDVHIIYSLQNSVDLITYYPLDLSFDLLQKATLKIINTDYFAKKFQMKAIHGDFTELINYTPIFGYDDHLNFFSLLGFTFGDFNEGELLGKISEGMNPGDFLLVDARLHDLELNGRITTEDKQKVLTNYNSTSNNRFAFGPLETVTIADFNTIEFELEVKTDVTVVPNAVNVITYCKNINTKFRSDNKTLKKNRINLTSTTLYSFESLREWFDDRGFSLVWNKKTSSIGLFLLRKNPDY